MKNVVAALTTIALAGSAFGQGQVEFRIVTLDDQHDLTIDTTSLSGPVDLEFYVQATIVGDPTATDFAASELSILDGGDAGVLGAAALTFAEAINFPGVPGMDPDGRAGLFPNYRVGVGNDNLGVGNGNLNPDMTGVNPDQLDILPINIAPLGAMVNGAFDNIYKLSWTTSDLSDRVVTLSTMPTSVDAAGYLSSVNGIVQPVTTINDTFNITFIPAPGTAALAATGLGFATLRRRRR